jgi:hypothetical protein
VLGAEGVCESGGIVNQLGSLPTAILANQVSVASSWGLCESGEIVNQLASLPATLFANQ